MLDVPMPLYDIQKSFAENMVLGPQFEKSIVISQDQKLQHRLFDYPIRSAIGIPACALMTSKGISLMSKLGFDIFTYKTIRSSMHPGHAMPNICYVCCSQQLSKNDIGTAVYVKDTINTINDIAIANSFGNNSLSLVESCADIAKARASLRSGQLLIVSVFGTESKERTSAEDFAYVARAAVDAGAHIIETNLSCPNLNCSAQPLYKNASLVHEISSAVVRAIDPIPLIIKVGVFDDEEQMRTILKMASKAGVRGICGINAVGMRIVNEQNNPYFGSERIMSGVSGNPIRTLALEFVRAAKKIIQEESLDLIIFGTGGIVNPEHFDEFFTAGATIAMSGAGAMFNPYLGIQYHEKATDPKEIS